MQEEAAELRRQIGVDSLYALIPAYDLWWKPFAEWTEEDLRHPEHLSLLWTITTGEVLAYPGIVERKKMKSTLAGAKPFDQFAQEFVSARRRRKQN